MNIKSLAFSLILLSQAFPAICQLAPRQSFESDTTRPITPRPLVFRQASSQEVEWTFKEGRKVKDISPSTNRADGVIFTFSPRSRAWRKTVTGEVSRAGTILISLAPEDINLNTKTTPLDYTINVQGPTNNPSILGFAYGPLTIIEDVTTTAAVFSPDQVEVDWLIYNLYLNPLYGPVVAGSGIGYSINSRGQLVLTADGSMIQLVTDSTIDGAGTEEDPLSVSPRTITINGDTQSIDTNPVFNVMGGVTNVSASVIYYITNSGTASHPVIRLTDAGITLIEGALQRSGGTMLGNINMGSNSVKDATRYEFANGSHITPVYFSIDPINSFIWQHDGSDYHIPFDAPSRSTDAVYLASLTNIVNGGSSGAGSVNRVGREVTITFPATDLTGYLQVGDSNTNLTNEAGFITEYIRSIMDAGTGISVAAVTNGNEVTYTVTCTITQYEDSDAVAAIKADADWNAADWDTAFGWGNHASAGYVESVSASAPNYTTNAGTAIDPDIRLTTAGIVLLEGALQRTGGEEQEMTGDLHMGGYTVVGQRFGDTAGRDASGSDWSAFGSATGVEASGSDWSAFGSATGVEASGNYWSAFGHTAGRDASGNNWGAFGSAAGVEASGNYWGAFGHIAGGGASGNDWSAFGSSAGVEASGNNWGAFGSAAGVEASGNYWGAFGYLSGYQATHTNSHVFGCYAGRTACGDNRMYLDVYAADPEYAAGGATNDTIVLDSDGRLYLGGGVARAENPSAGVTLRGSVSVGGVERTTWPESGISTNDAAYVSALTNLTGSSGITVSGTGRTRDISGAGLVQSNHTGNVRIDGTLDAAENIIINSRGIFSGSAVGTTGVDLSSPEVGIHGGLILMTPDVVELTNALSVRIPAPTDDDHAATKLYVDTARDTRIPTTGTASRLLAYDGSGDVTVLEYGTMIAEDAADYYDSTETDAAISTNRAAIPSADSITTSTLALDLAGGLMRHVDVQTNVTAITIAGATAGTIAGQTVIIQGADSYSVGGWPAGLVWGSGDADNVTNAWHRFWLESTGTNLVIWAAGEGSESL